MLHLKGGVMHNITDVHTLIDVCTNCVVWYLPHLPHVPSSHQGLALSNHLTVAITLGLFPQKHRHS